MHKVMHKVMHRTAYSPMYAFLMALGLFISPTTATGQSEKLVKLCKSNATEFEKRLRACDQIIQLQAGDPQAWPIAERGDALSDEGEHERAILEFQRAQEFDPADKRALAGQAFSAYRTEKHEMALEAITKLLKIEPEDYWNHYIQGQILRGLDRQDQALAAFDASIAINGDYFWSRFRRAFVFMGAEQWDKAAMDLDVAVAQKPLHARAQLAMADTQYALGNNDLAARHYQIAQSLEPNYSRPTYRIEELIALKPDPDMPPANYRDPDGDQQIEYLMTLLPVDPRSEMERSIQAIANWFSAETKATPEAAAVLSFTSVMTGKDELTVTPMALASENFPKGQAAPTTSFRGLFPLLIQPGGPQGPQIQIRYDGNGPSEAWPLKVGNSVTGTGSFAILCPETFNLGAALMGCRPDVIEVDVGRLEYNLYVDRTEEVFVPMGKFQTYVLRYRELSFLELGGVKNDRVVESTWWISPNSGIWVKRTGEQGGKILTLQAMRRVQP